MLILFHNMKLNFQNPNRSKTFSDARGFTLVETIVAIAIFAFAITGLISITATGVFNTNFVKNKFTASYLALEGAELARGIRDSSSLAGNSWAVILSSPTILGNCIGAQGCRIDAWTQTPPFDCNNDGSQCRNLSYDRGSGKFNYDFPDNVDTFESIFRRTIKIENAGTEEVRVISRVDWLQGSEPHSVTYTYNLLDWTTGP